jgi:hypothetical protein
MRVFTEQGNQIYRAISGDAVGWQDDRNLATRGLDICNAETPADVITAIEDLNPPQGTEQSLPAQLNAAIDALNRGIPM